MRFIGFPPTPQELRARKIGHVLVNSAVDRPWSQYFCCMAVGEPRVRPAASRRDQAGPARHPEGGRPVRPGAGAGGARRSSTAGSRRATSTRSQLVKELPYDRWREYDPEDTVRFYALRLHEVGMIKSSPQKIIAQGTDWRFLNELKRELKG